MAWMMLMARCVNGFMSVAPYLRNKTMIFYSILKNLTFIINTVKSMFCYKENSAIADPLDDS